ncbi:hypothetical protein [Pontibacter vulgaris]|uniref:hypothetical protein n=1 Tax=Pontibacter vulgaris TaxID=2905679 RepID=UPI001FA7DDB2|nr:hypothetical protein [Pontibacter vulgaris]
MDLENLFENSSKVGWPDLYYFQEEFDLIFFAERKIIENAEQFIKGLDNDLKLKVKSDSELQKKALDEQEEAYQAQYYDHFYGHTELIINQVLQNQRNASVLSIFSLVEGNLKALCNLVEGEFNFKIKVNDLGGSDDIQKYWVYLDKVFCLDTSKLEPFYTPIKQQKYFRNKIAHNNSKIDENRIQLVRQTPGLKVTSYGKNHILTIAKPDYVEKLLTDSQAFFDNLIELMHERFAELIK